MRKITALIILGCLLTGCVTVPADRVFTGRIYNLSTGEIIPAVAHTDRAGKSLLTAGPTRSGETFSGEATSIENAVQSSSYGNESISNAGSAYSTYVSSSSYAVSRPGYQNGTAILVGNEGTVIDIVYQVNLSGTGEGEGKDNKGINYRILF
jgi:hypothetical protein